MNSSRLARVSLRVRSQIKQPQTARSTVSSTQYEPLTKNMKIAFQSFLDKLQIYLSDNSSSVYFRDNISTILVYVVKKFDRFASLVTTELSSKSAMSDGKRRDLIKGSQPTITASREFICNWNNLAAALEATNISGPKAIIESAYQQYEIIIASLKSVISSNKDPNNIHNPTHRICSSFINQIEAIYQSVSEYLENPADTETAKSLETEIRQYSRQLSEAFIRSFPAGGISSSVLTSLKTQAYAACSDLTHAVKSASLFNKDIEAVFIHYDHFYDCLVSILDVLFISHDELYGKHGTKDSSEVTQIIERVIEGEVTPHFDIDLNLVDFVDSGSIMECSNPALQSEYFSILRHKVNAITEQLDLKTSELSSKEKELKEQKELYESQLELERSTNQSLSDEIDRLNEEMESKAREIKLLRDKQEDNEFKQCLRGIAKKLGGVLQEETVNFNDEDDDQLISYVNALSVYVVERKCQKCVVNLVNEAKVRKMFEPYIGEIDGGLLELGEAASTELEQTVQNLKDVTNELSKCQNELQDLHESISQVMEKCGSNDLSLVAAVQAKLDKNQKEIDDLKTQHKSEIDQLSYQIVSILKAETDNPTDAARWMVDKHAKLVNENNGLRTCLENVNIHLSQFLKVEQLNKSLVDSVNHLVEKIDHFDNPLAPLVADLNRQLANARSSIQVIDTRMRGLANHQMSKEDTSIMTIHELTNHVLDALSSVQDHIEKYCLKNKNLIQENQAMRQALETLDLKMHRYLRLENIDLSKLQLIELIGRLDRFVDGITKPSASKFFIEIKKVDELCAPFFDIIPVTTRTDPTHYLPEIYQAFSNHENSLKQAEPFSQGLEQMAKSIDWTNLRNQGQDLLQKIISIHEQLIKLRPNSISTSLFTIIERSTEMLTGLIRELIK